MTYITLIAITLVLVNNNIAFILFVLFCVVIFVIIQLYFWFVYFLSSIFLILNLCLMLILICSDSFVTHLLDLCMLIGECSYVLFCFSCRSTVQFFVLVNFSNVFQVFIMYLNLWVYLFVLVSLVLCSFFDTL